MTRSLTDFTTSRSRGQAPDPRFGGPTVQFGVYSLHLMTTMDIFLLSGMDAAPICDDRKKWVV